MTSLFARAPKVRNPNTGMNELQTAQMSTVDDVVFAKPAVVLSFIAAKMVTNSKWHYK